MCCGSRGSVFSWVHHRSPRLTCTTPWGETILSSTKPFNAIPSIKGPALLVLLVLLLPFCRTFKVGGYVSDAMSMRTQHKGDVG
jgi:hypothetical protein